MTSDFTVEVFVRIEGRDQQDNDEEIVHLVHKIHNTVDTFRGATLLKRDINLKGRKKVKRG